MSLNQNQKNQSLLVTGLLMATSKDLHLRSLLDKKVVSLFQHKTKKND